MHQASDARAAEGQDDASRPPQSGLGRALLAVLVVGSVAAVFLTVGPARLWRKDAAATPGDDVPAKRVVQVAVPRPSEDSTLSLPANIDAFQITSLFARVNGYLCKWNADIGRRVKKGQVLAEIDTPEMDQDLRQAQANLVQGNADLNTAVAELEEAENALKQSDADIARAKADLEYARAVHHRNEQLSAEHAIADQDLDLSRREREMRAADLAAAIAQQKTRQSAVATARVRIKSREAAIKALEASVRRLEEMQVFKTIVAPFDGVVIRRRAEVGMLVAAGGTTATPELFAVAQADTLRIRICVPQSQSTGIETGQEAKVLVAEYPGKVFSAKVARTAHAIDPVSRTLTVELELPNGDQALLPGMFARVELAVRRSAGRWTVPAVVLASKSGGLYVAVVDDRSVVRFRKVQLGRDYGSRVEVLAGLRGKESLVTNPPDDLADNEAVTIAGAAADPAPQGGPATDTHGPKTP
jgi:RND family efflux transporter MFP subunit